MIKSVNESKILKMHMQIFALEKNTELTPKSVPSYFLQLHREQVYGNMELLTNILPTMHS